MNLYVSLKQLVDLSCTVNCLMWFWELLNVPFWHTELNTGYTNLVSSPYHFFPSFEQLEILIFALNERFSFGDEAWMSAGIFSFAVKYL